MHNNTLHKLGIDIGSTTVKVAVLDENDNLLFSDYERHFANIRETLSLLVEKAYKQLGDMQITPMITGSGGLTLAKHLDVPFVQEVISVSTALDRSRIWASFSSNETVRDWKPRRLYSFSAWLLNTCRP